MHLPTGSDVVFDLDPLAHDIDAAQSSYRVLAPKIEVKLVKKEGGIKWAKIEGEDEVATKMETGEFSKGVSTSTRAARGSGVILVGASG